MSLRSALEKIVFKDTQAEADIAKIKLDFYTQRKKRLPTRFIPTITLRPEVLLMSI